MNEMTTTANNSLANFSGADPFASAARDMGAKDNGTFLKFSGNTGDFTYGPADNSEELAHGTQLVINMAAIERGHICWKDSEVVDEVMVNILAGNPPAQSSLEDHGPYEKYPDGTEDGWSEQTAAVFRDLESGQAFTFKTTSGSGLKGLGALLNDFSKVYKNHPGDYPVVELGANGFIPKKNKKVGKKYAPVFKIVGWIAGAEYDALVAQGDAAKEAAQSEGAGDAGGEGDDTNQGAGADDPSNYADAGATVTKVETKPAAAVKEEPKADTAAPAGRRAKRF